MTADQDRGRVSRDPSNAATKLEYTVSAYDAQRDGMAVVSGWQVRAQVTAPTGRKFAPVPVALCPSKDDAEEIAELLDAKHGGCDV